MKMIKNHSKVRTYDKNNPRLSWSLIISSWGALTNLKLGMRYLILVEAWGHTRLAGSPENTSTLCSLRTYSEALEYS